MADGSQVIDSAETEVSLRDEISTALDASEPDTGKPDVSEAARTLAAARKSAPEGNDTVTGGQDTLAGGQDTLSGGQDTISGAQEKLEAPHHWPTQAKELFAKQSPEGQKFLLDRHKAMEADYTRKTQELTPVRRMKESLDEIFAPMRDSMYRDGIDEVTAIRQLVAAHNYLQQKPEEAVQWLAGKYGIDLKAIVEGTAGNGQVSPELLALREEVAQLKHTQQSSLSAQQQQQFRANLSQVEQFAGEKDAQGNLKHPYFDEVAQEVAMLMRVAQEQGKPISLQDAHDRAVYANPQVRSKVLAAQDAERRKKEEDERKAKADAAKRASAGNITGQGASTSVVANTNSVRADLEAAFAGSEGRV